MFVLLLSLILTVLQVEVNTTIVAREFELFARDTEKYVILISILSHAVGLLPNLALGTPSTHTLKMEILSSCFPRLVQDALDLPVCRAFVATATILPGVNLLEPDVPPKSRCRLSIAVPIQEIDRMSRPSPQQINLTAHPVFTLLASLQS